MGMMVYFLLGIPKLETRSPGCSDSVLGMVMFVEWGCSELPGLLVQGKGGPTGQPPAHGCFPFSMVELPVLYLLGTLTARAGSAPSFQ